MMAGEATETAEQEGGARWSTSALESLDRWRKPLFVALALGFLLAYNGGWRIEPDSAVYLSLGRNLAWGRGYVYQGSPNDLIYPGLPYALSALFRTLGPYAIAGADVLMMCCAAAALALTYRLLCLAIDRPTAVLVTLSVGCSHLFFRYSHEILTDMPFLTGVMGVLAGYEGIFGGGAPTARRGGRWWDWALLAGGLVVAISVRPTMFGLVGSVLASLAWIAIRRRGALGAVLAATGLTIGVLAVFMWLDPRHAAGHGMGAYERAAMYGQTPAVGHYLSPPVKDNIKDLFGLSAARAVMGARLGPDGSPPIVILCCVILAGGLALARRRPLWGLWVAATIAMMVKFSSTDRYLLEALPLLILGWWQIGRWVNLRLPRRAGNWAFAALMTPCLLVNIGDMGIMIFQQHQSPFLDHYQHRQFAGYDKMGQAVARTAGSGDLVLSSTQTASMLSYLSDRRVREEDDGDLRGVEFERLFVVVDPSDAAMSRWLAQERVTLDKEPLATAARPKGKPSLELVRARREP